MASNCLMFRVSAFFLASIVVRLITKLKVHHARSLCPISQFKGEHFELFQVYFHSKNMSGKLGQLFLVVPLSYSIL